MQQPREARWHVVGRHARDRGVDAADDAAVLLAAEPPSEVGRCSLRVSASVSSVLLAAGFVVRASRGSSHSKQISAVSWSRTYAKAFVNALKTRSVKGAHS